MTSPKRPSAGAGKGSFRAGRFFKRALILAAALVGAWLWLVWPPPAWYRWWWPRQTAFMALRRSQESNAIARGEQKGPLSERLYYPVHSEQIAPVMRTAALVAEDHRFFQHSGIDYVEIRHALGYQSDDFSWTSSRDRAQLWRVLGRVWERRDRLRGASTITQQLAKNLYLSPSRNPLRKLKEAVTAWRLEYWLGKDRILELYLNVVELGPGIWGVDAASRKYFGHSARQLSLEEAAALAGSLPFPLRSNPVYRPGRMRWRQNMIIRRVRGEDVEIPKDGQIPDTVKGDPAS